MCKAVNLRASAYDVYIGRPGHGKSGEFGNPFIVGVHGARGECVALFKKWFNREIAEALKTGDSPQGLPKRVLDDPTCASFIALVDARIKPGMRLGCFCKPDACHGDIIAAYVNNGYKFHGG